MKMAASIAKDRRRLWGAAWDFGEVESSGMSIDI